MKQYFKRIEQRIINGIDKKRIDLKMTKEELCLKSNIKTMTYYNALKGRSSLSLKNVISLCKAVGIKTLNLD
jgi:DNA-binding XRE family transcriptional regulator